MYILNKVGLEAEFLLRDSNGELVYPENYGFGYDEFRILGEFRADAGTTRHETVGKFIQSLVEVINLAQKNKLTIDFSGLAIVSPQKKAEIIRKVGAKYVPPCTNIYKTDILNFSDDVVENGSITASRISAGLHVHFSRRVYQETTEFIGDKEISRTYDRSLLTPSQIKNIIRNMDKKILPSYSLDVPLKYRQPGFYEIKPWGFEYRSLPMTERFINLGELRLLVDFAFGQLEKLEK